MVLVRSINILLGLGCGGGFRCVLTTAAAAWATTFARNAMQFVTARDAKFFPRQLAVTAGVQNGFDVAAQMRPDADACFVQGVDQRLRDCAAKQQIQVEFRQRAGQRIGWLHG